VSAAGLVIEKLEPNDVLWQALWRRSAEYELFLRVNQRGQIWESARAWIQR
jgi:hypothetical protein